MKFVSAARKNALFAQLFSEPFIAHISEANIKQYSQFTFSRELKHFYKSYKKKQSKYNTLHVNMSDTDITTYNSDDESDRRWLYSAI